MNAENIAKKIKPIIKAYSQIKLVYLFGSRINGAEGPLSDIDLAFYVEEKNAQKILNLKLELMDKISRQLKTDKIDILMLNTAKSPEIKYNILKNGKLIYGEELYKVIVEPKILNEYFDFRSFLLRHNLTKAK